MELKQGGRRQYNIVTSSNSGLVLQLAVSLTAIAANLGQDQIDFYLLHSEISQKNIKILSELCNVYGNITFHEIRVPEPEVYDLFVEAGGWCREAYYSLCIHQMLPKTVDRILYIDAGDVLILGNIEPYYACDFEGNLLVVTAQKYKRENGVPVPYEANDLVKEEMRACILDGIFNSGSYVMNLKGMREAGIALEFYVSLTKWLKETSPNVNQDLRPDAEKESLLYYGDQGLLSAAFAGRLKYYGYPQMRESWYAPYNFGLGYYTHYDQRPDWQPRVVHFAGVPFKPWHANFSVFPERLRVGDLNELKPLQVEYYYLWLEYFLCTLKMLPLNDLGF